MIGPVCRYCLAGLYHRLRIEPGLQQQLGGELIVRLIDEVPPPPSRSEGRVDFPAVRAWKAPLLHAAASRFLGMPGVVDEVVYNGLSRIEGLHLAYGEREVLSDIDVRGYTRDGDTYYSRGYAEGRPTLRVEIASALSSITVETGQ